MTKELLSRLDDATLTGELLRLACRERGATVQLILHLAEFDARRLYLGAGFPSLFAYCRQMLRLSESESYSRIEAARASRSFPRIPGLLADGTINLTTIRLLAPHLTPENGDALLDEAKCQSKREVEELLASRFPRPDVATLIRRQPERAISLASSAALQEPTPSFSLPRVAPATRLPAAGPVADRPEPSSTDSEWPHEPRAIEASQETVRGVEASAKGTLTPPAPGRYLIRFTASAKTRDKLVQARDLLRHAVPSGDLAAVVDRGLDLLIDKLLREKAGLTGGDQRHRPRRSLDRGSRHIPAGVRREVWIRDGGRCAFLPMTGRRCAATSRLEFHHRRPYGIGGEATVENIELRCRAHNAYESSLFYGAARLLDPVEGPRGSVSQTRALEREPRAVDLSG